MHYCKEMREKLLTIHGGTSQVKETKISMHVHAYEMFIINEDETIPKMHEGFIKITNELKCLGKIYLNKEHVIKILRSFPLSWMPKVTTIMEVKDLDNLPLDKLMGSLTTH